MPKIKDFILSYISIVISIISSLIMLPLYIAHFGSEQYGAWIVINTFIQYLALANFGLPTSLTIIASNLQNKALIKPLFYRSLSILSVVVLSVAILFLAAVKFDLIKSNIFFGNTSKNQFYFLCLVFCFGLYCLRAPVQLASCIFLATGKVYLSKIYEILNNISMPLAFIVVYLLNGTIMSYVVISGIMLLVIAIVSFIHSSYLFNSYAKPNLLDQNDEKVPKRKEILRLSAGYFVISIGAALVWNTDNLVIAHFLPLTEVTSYSVTFRIYTTAFLVFNTINNVLLPYYGIYKSQNRLDLMQKSFKNALFISSFLAGIIWVLTFIFSKDIILFWTKDPSLYAGKYLFLILGCYGFILSLLSTVSTLFSSMKIIKIMIFITFAEGFSNLIVSLSLVKQHGLYGVAIGTVTGSLISLLIICSFFNRYVGDFVKLPTRTICFNLILVLSFLGVAVSIGIYQLDFIYKILFSILFLASFSFIGLKINNLNIKDFKNISNE